MSFWRQTLTILMKDLRAELRYELVSWLSASAGVDVLHNQARAGVGRDHSSMLAPRYASRTASSLTTCSGVPPAITRP